MNFFDKIKREKRQESLSAERLRELQSKQRWVKINLVLRVIFFYGLVVLGGFFFFLSRGALEKIYGATGVAGFIQNLGKFFQEFTLNPSYLGWRDSASSNQELLQNAPQYWKWVLEHPWQYQSIFQSMLLVFFGCVLFILVVDFFCWTHRKLQKLSAKIKRAKMDIDEEAKALDQAFKSGLNRGQAQAIMKTPPHELLAGASVTVQLAGDTCTWGAADLPDLMECKIRQFLLRVLLDRGLTEEEARRILHAPPRMIYTVDEEIVRRHERRIHN